MQLQGKKYYLIVYFTLFAPKSHCSHCNDQLGSLMRATRSLLAGASGVTIVHLWNAMLADIDLSDDVDNDGNKRRRRDSEIPIENLELSFNQFMDYEDIPHPPLTLNSIEGFDIQYFIRNILFIIWFKVIEPWEVVCSWMMTKFHNLKSVDFSHCLGNTRITLFRNILHKFSYRYRTAGYSILQRLIGGTKEKASTGTSST